MRVGGRSEATAGFFIFYEKRGKKLRISTQSFLFKFISLLVYKFTVLEVTDIINRKTRKDEGLRLKDEGLRLKDEGLRLKDEGLRL